MAIYRKTRPAMWMRALLVINAIWFTRNVLKTWELETRDLPLELHLIAVESLQRNPVIRTEIVAQQKQQQQEENGDRSKNEEIYDEKYWAWQANMNKFGAAIKGDVIKHLIKSNKDKPPQTILEFGCSGGYILDAMPVAQKYGVEINPSSRAFAKKNFPKIQEVFPRPEDIPQSLQFDVIYTTSVLEHVDCPLCELRKLKEKLKPTGMLVVGLKNDGADMKQTFANYGNEPNHHIYTWNPLLLANLLDSAGYKVCNSVGEFSAWHAIDVSKYQADKHAYCIKGLQVGQNTNVHNMWAVAVPETQDCQEHKQRLDGILNCKHLIASG